VRFNKLDLNQLVVLDAILSERSVSRAAERLFLSQSATSCALARLREYFKDELVAQVGRTLVPTPLAQDLMKPIRDVLLQIQTITTTQPTFDPLTCDRRFVVEASDYVISVLLLKVVNLAEELAPRMQFDLRVLVPESGEHLDRGEVDFLLVPEFHATQGHPSQAVFSDAFSCLVCVDHPIRGPAITKDEYFGAAHVGLHWGAGQLTTFDDQFISKSGHVRRQEVIAPTFTCVPELLIDSKRIATLPSRLAHQMAKRFPLRVLECPVKIPGFTENLHWHRYQEHDPATSWLRELIADTARNLPDVTALRPRPSKSKRSNVTFR
jgi:DNA-binding transcriptional LysR family regulator